MNATSCKLICHYIICLVGYENKEKIKEIFVCRQINFLYKRHDLIPCVFVKFFLSLILPISYINPVREEVNKI